MKNNINGLMTPKLLFGLFFLIVTSTSKAQSGKDSLQIINSVDKIVEQAIFLINSPDPEFEVYVSDEPESSEVADLGFEQPYKNVAVTFEMRDGKHLSGYKYSSQSTHTIILLHGSLSTAYLYNKTAGLLREATGAEVIALDCRGHGASYGKKGDLSYIDQYTDDLSDLIALVKREKPDGKVILSGHSMGGGIALRYAMRRDVPNVDGYLMFAPLLGKNSPTIPKPIPHDGQKHEFIKAHIPRIIGLKVLNLLQNHEYDSLPVLYFNLPEEFPFRHYSYRANESMSPDDYKEGLLSVRQPLLVLVGSEDEAFVASAFEPAITKYSEGKVVVLEGLSHSGIRHSKKAMKIISDWFKTDLK